ncbi:M28 family peptidase [Streptomyces venezuelae]|uniref:M28 family peptidase n=1 Tax=Streptomyces venezuelae TaxID=54571 RepID=UPI0037B03BD0
MERAVSEPSAFEHLRALQRITDAHGGRRAAGGSGYAAAADYVKERLVDAGYRVRVQPFSVDDFKPVTERATVLGPERHELRPLMAQFSPSTPEGGIRERVAVVPGPGCTPAEYAQAAAHGRIALVRAKTCSLADKQQAAADAGVRVLLMNLGAPGADMNLRYFIFPPEAGRIPTALLSRGDSERLMAAADAGRPAQLDVELRGHRMTTRTFNLLADTPTGDDGRTVVVGAHLDGAREGPGINDNASSSAAILETALRLAPYFEKVRHRVRFAWWGAEELGMLGSTHYVSALSPAELRAQALNLNFEMIGASNYARLVYDGDDSDGTGAGAGPPGSDTIEREFTEVFARRGLPTVGLDFDGRSDFGPFIDAGIPAGGGSGGYDVVKSPEWQRLFGGTAGQYLDPCYHQLCDRLDAVNRTIFGQFTHAMAYVTGRFAQDLDGIPARPGPARGPQRG